MRVEDKILNCSFYLYENETEADQSVSRGGSGFFVGVPVQDSTDRFHVFPVTCRHVIEKGFCTVRVNLRSGGTEVITSDKDNWYCSQDNDIAIGKIPLREECQITVVPQSLFVTKDWSEEEKIGVGDEVYVVGRLLDHDHKERNTPVARFGRLARTGTIRHRSPCLEKDVETFFCDVKSVGGFSGSPVFVEISALDDRRGTVNLSAGRKGPRLLGVDWGHTQRRQPLRKMLPITHEGGHQEEEVPDLFVYRNSGIICVAPAWELLEILEAPEFAQIRQAIERKERSDE